MGKTLSNVDKGTRQDLIIRLISERSLGTQQDVVAALSDVGVEVAQATVSGTSPSSGSSRSVTATSRCRTSLAPPE
jgi:hypothetical protein